MPDPVTSRGAAATKRVTTGPARRTAAGPPLKTKAEKRAEAKAAKARALAMRKRRRALAVGGAAVAVLAVVVGLIGWIATSSSHPGAAPAGPSAAASPSPSASASPGAAASSAAFPPVPPGADPALSKKPTVTKGTDRLTTLKATTLVQGTGAAVEAGQTITVNYVGVTYAGGKEFDSSWSHSEPFSFPVGAGRVIKGWDQGLIGVKVGSRVRLDIPAALAYGDHPAPPQPAGALRFVVDVLSAA